MWEKQCLLLMLSFPFLCVSGLSLPGGGPLGSVVVVVPSCVFAGLFWFALRSYFLCFAA